VWLGRVVGGQLGFWGARREREGERVHSSGLFDSVQLRLLRARNGGFRADDLPGVCEGAIQWQMSDRRLRYGDGWARLVTRREVGMGAGLPGVEAEDGLIGRADKEARPRGGMLVAGRWSPVLECSGTWALMEGEGVG